jgi:hypothetical protein
MNPKMKIMNNRNRIILLLFLLLFSCGEIKDSFYKTLDDAKRSGAVERGWLPPILPDSSYEIYERHNIDTNAVLARFKVNKSDMNKLMSQLEKIQPGEIDSIQFPQPRIKWWPKEINKNSIGKGPNGLRLFKYKRIISYSDNKQNVEQAFIIIDAKSEIIYYWQ